MNLNKVFILGNLTRDPEKRSLPSGQAVVSFGVATNRFYTNQNNEKQQDVEFHNITTFGKLAEIASQYLQKGSLVLIEGRLRTRDWQDASGIKHYRTEIIAENLQLGPRFQNRPQEPRSNPRGKTLIQDQDIPVIEEGWGNQLENRNNKENSRDSSSSPKESLTNTTKFKDKEDEDEEEIDVRKIPF